MPRPATYALLLALLLSGCATYSLVEPKRTPIGDLYTVEPQIPWSAAKSGKYEIWTVDGRLLQQLRKEYALTVIMATHDIGVVPIHCDAVACLNRTLHLHGRPEEILKSEVFKKLYGTEVEAVMHGRIPHRMIGGHRD